MRLTAKLVLIILLGISLLTAVHGYRTVRREDQRLKAEMRDQAEHLGQVLESEILLAWRRGGPEAVLQLIHNANLARRRVAIRLVLLDAPDGHPEHPAVPSDQLSVFQLEGTVSIIRRDDRGVDYLHTYYPIDVDSGRKRCLEFSESLSDVNE